MKRTIRIQDPFLFLLALLITGIGLVFILDAGYPRAFASNRAAFGYFPPEFVAQLRFLPIAIVAALLAGNVAPGKWKKWARPTWILALLGLIGVKVFGHEMNGAQRWIDIGPVSIQPAEFAKFAAILYLAAAFADRPAWPEKLKPANHWAIWMDRFAVPKILRALPLVWVLFAVVLIEKEPDLGTAAVVAATSFFMLIAGGVSKKSIMAALLIGSVGIGFMVHQEPYRLERIENHFHRWSAENVDDVGFQTVQAETGAAAGGWTGVGFGAGRTKHILPATTTDFIMATIAEETGLLGSLLVLGLIGALVYRLMWNAARAPSHFGQLFLIGVAGWTGIQASVNVMMANGFLPAIGIPLPLISSGGSSLVATWIALGVCQAVMRPELAVVSVSTKEAFDEARDHGRRDRRTRLSRA